MPEHVCPYCGSSKIWVDYILDDCDDAKTWATFPTHCRECDEWFLSNYCLVFVGTKER